MAPVVKSGDHFTGLIGPGMLRSPQRFDRAIFDLRSSSSWASRKIPRMKRLIGLPGEDVRLSVERATARETRRVLF